jgi:hypothetical protein
VRDVPRGTDTHRFEELLFARLGREEHHGQGRASRRQLDRRADSSPLQIEVEEAHVGLETCDRLDELLHRADLSAHLDPGGFESQADTGKRRHAVRRNHDLGGVVPVVLAAQIQIDPLTLTFGSKRWQVPAVLNRPGFRGVAASKCLIRSEDLIVERKSPQFITLLGEGFLHLDGVTFGRSWRCGF